MKATENGIGEVEEGSRPQHARWVVASLALCTLLPALGTSSTNVALPTLAGVFGTSFQQVQWVVLAYLLATTASIVSVGRLGDVAGRRRLLVAGVLLFTVASALCAIAPWLWLLIAARALQGLGAAVMMSLAMAFVGQAVPSARTGSAMGLLGTTSAVGTALGPSLGGAMIATFGWRSIFLLNLPLGAAAVVLAWRFLPTDSARRDGVRVGFDLAGTLLLSLTLGSYALAMTVGRGSFGALDDALLATAAAGAGLFVMVERRADSPLVDLGILSEPALSASLAMSGLVSTVMMATLVVGPFYLARGLGLGTALVGLVMSAGPVVAAVAGVPSGRAVDRFGTQRATVVGLSAMIAGCAALALTPARTGIAGYVIPIAVITAGYALFQAANNTAVMANVHPTRRGVVSGMLNLSRNLGLITGASVMGAIFAMASRRAGDGTAPAEAAAFGLHVTFAVAAMLVAGALAVAVATRAAGAWEERAVSAAGAS